MTDITGRVHHLNFSVTDLGRSVAWYADVFGLEQLVKLDDEHGAWSKVILRHPGGLLVGLTAHTANPGDAFDEHRTGLDHVALAVADARALAAWERRLDELGIEHSEIKTTPLGQLITFRDPDDIQLEVYAAAST